jgi:hypothetical protein
MSPRFQKQKRRAGDQPARRDSYGRGLVFGWHLQFGANVHVDLGWIIINEVPDATVWDEPELRPFPQGTDRWLFAFGKYSAKAETDDVRELIFNGGR